MSRPGATPTPAKKWTAEHRANFLATQKRMLEAGEWGNGRKPRNKKKNKKTNGHGGHRPAAHTPEAIAKRIASSASTRAAKAAHKNGEVIATETEGISFPLDSFPFPEPHRVKRAYVKAQRPAVHAIPLQTVVSEGDKLILVNKLADLFNKLLA